MRREPVRRCTIPGISGIDGLPRGKTGPNRRSRVNAVQPDQVQHRKTRRYRRYPFHRVVQLRDRTGDNLHTLDLCEGGVALRGDRPFGIGEAIEVVLLDGNVRVAGVVCYELQAEDGWRIGIRFVEPQPELLVVALSLTADLR